MRIAHPMKKMLEEIRAYPTSAAGTDSDLLADSERGVAGKQRGGGGGGGGPGPQTTAAQRAAGPAMPAGRGGGGSG